MQIEREVDYIITISSRYVNTQEVRGRMIAFDTLGFEIEIASNYRSFVKGDTVWFQWDMVKDIKKG